MSVVGDRYAESLFDLAKEENKVTQYLDDIKLPYITYIKLFFNFY